MAKSPKVAAKTNKTKAPKEKKEPKAPKAKKEPKAPKEKKSSKATKAESELELNDVPIVDKNAFDIVSFMDESLIGIEKKTKTTSDSMNRYAERVSTGQLALDMYLNGGIVPGGWYTFSGGEQSCKSTFTMSVMASVIRTNFQGLALVHDYEGSTDADYVSNQLECFGVKIDAKTIFGVRDEESGAWIIRPRIRYYSPTSGEAYFNYMGMLRRTLPDKVVEKDGTAYYLFENTKENAKKLKGKYDVKWFSKNNQFKIKAPDGQMQVLSIIDSYPAMLPESQDQDDPSGAMAVQARMFSDGIKRFRGGMRRKMITVVGVNQLRQKPACMFGDPAYEPCGDALKFYCFSGDTYLNTDRGRIKASELMKTHSYNTPIELESIGGIQKALGIQLVPEQRKAVLFNVSGHKLVVSDRHRIHCLQQFVYPTGESSDLRACYATADTIRNSGSVHDFASIRLPSPEEVNARPDITAIRTSCWKTLGDHNLKEAEIPSYFGIRTRWVQTDEMQPEEASTLVADLLYCGILAVVVRLDTVKDHFVVRMPVLRNESIIYQCFLTDTSEDACLRLAKLQEHQRDIYMQLAAAKAYPQVILALNEFNDHIDRINRTAPVKEPHIHLNNTDAVMKAFDQALTQEFEPTVCLNEATYDGLIEKLAYIEDFYSLDDNLVPVYISEIDHLQEEMDMFDVCVPETEAVVTNGILSHNSDVRVRLTSRAIPPGWKGEGGIVTEKSATVEDGLDRYRFIAARTIKNKLGGVPNQTTWFRLWESDGNGKARGFDPVFDTFHYLKTLGIITGTRNRMKFAKPCPLYAEKAKAIDWDQFRTLINGSKKQIVEVCSDIGVKPVGLRLWAFKYVMSEAGRNHLRDSISRAGKASDDGTED